MYIYYLTVSPCSTLAHSFENPLIMNRNKWLGNFKFVILNKCAPPTPENRENSDGLLRVCGNSTAFALELPQSCTKPSTWSTTVDESFKNNACFATVTLQFLTRTQGCSKAKDEKHVFSRTYFKHSFLCPNSSPLHLTNLCHILLCACIQWFLTGPQRCMLGPFGLEWPTTKLNSTVQFSHYINPNHIPFHLIHIQTVLLRQKQVIIWVI